MPGTPAEAAGVHNAARTLPGIRPSVGPADADDVATDAGQASAFRVAPAALALTDSMPASRLAADAYIWLVPITWWLAARRLK